MLQRTWDYGTTKNATINSVIEDVVLLRDEDAEGHVIAGVDHDVQPVAGARVTIRFCKGGPTGGYWKIVGSQREGSE